MDEDGSESELWRWMILFDGAVVSLILLTRQLMVSGDGRLLGIREL
jgi:hypothetical protein